MKKIYLKKEGTCHYYDDEKDYQFKETTCERFFLWVPKFTRKECYFNEENHKEGHGVELLRTKFEYFLKQEKSDKTFLNGNTDKELKYNKDPQKEATRRYKSKDNITFQWPAVVDGGNWGHLNIKSMFDNSEYKTNSKGESVIYDRKFFDSINYNISSFEKAVDELKKTIRKGDESLVEEAKGYKSPLAVKNLTTKLRVEYIILDSTKKLREDLKKVLPINKDEKEMFRDGVTHSIHFNTNSLEVECDSYTSLM